MTCMSGPHLCSGISVCRMRWRSGDHQLFKKPVTSGGRDIIWRLWRDRNGESRDLAKTRKNLCLDRTEPGHRSIGEVDAGPTDTGPGEWADFNPATRACVSAGDRISGKFQTRIAEIDIQDAACRHMRLQHDMKNSYRLLRCNCNYLQRRAIQRNGHVHHHHRETGKDSYYFVMTKGASWMNDFEDWQE